MGRKLINDGWEFSEQVLGTGLENVASMDFAPVNLPHDWLIYDTDNLYKDSTGWYRRRFDITKEEEKRYEIYFEGVYMDSKVYLNGSLVGEWKYGYSSFFFDVTDYLVDGKNELLVRVDFQSPNSRWYSGAGIYRDVYMRVSESISFVTDSLYISATPQDESRDKWNLLVSAELQKCSKDATMSRLTIPELEIDTDFSKVENDFVSYKLNINKPELWSLDNPKLYDCILSLDNGETISARFGFRHFTYDCNKGMFVNGEHVKINGVCEHHDFGALGAVFSKTAMRRKLEILRGMGVNAIRTSHNMPAPELLDLTDEMGFLVMDEAFDMWENCKTNYDYGRFFKEWHSKDVRSWIRRDRNHPSIFMWSIGNEIYDTHKDEHGAEITEMLKEEVLEHDALGNAVIGIGSNFMPWENAQKCADILKFAGYNYGEKYYDKHHEKYSDWYIFGSETSSTVQSRGVYHFPLRQSVLADDDLQCSSLGNSSTSWGAKNPEFCIITERDREFSMGQFLWTGFDYIGEPTPYHTRNSYFGQVDTAGFPKDTYYIYKAAWTDYRTEPFVHVFPHWDFNPGQIIDIRVASNAPEVELIVNGRSMGRKKIDRVNGDRYTGDWEAAYEPGEIVGIAYDENGKEIARESRKSYGEPARLQIRECKVGRELTAGARDYAFLEVSAVDAEGNEVSNANNRINVTVEGAGWIAGLDNGDSTDMDQYKGSTKRLFSGKMLICVAIGSRTGKIAVSAASEGLEGASIELNVEKSIVIEGMSLVPEYECVAIKEGAAIKEGIAIKEGAAASVDIRKIELVSSCCSLNAELDSVMVHARLFTGKGSVIENSTELATYNLKWKAVNDSGIESPLASIGPAANDVVLVRAKGDGIFHLRCSAFDEKGVARVISQLDFSASGIGESLLNPYGYIAGGMWDYAEGEMGSGNNHGVATPRGERAVVGFDKIDFGSYGADEIKIDLFVLTSDEFPIQIWQGIPGEKGSEMLADVIYCKPSIWNTYQPETYKLNRRVNGIQRICFVTQNKAHIGGFSFIEKNKAYERLEGASCDNVYGDAFTVGEHTITDIGNNVTIEYYDMDFGTEGPSFVEIEGFTPNAVNTIHILYDCEGAVTREIAEFSGNGEKTQRFAINGFKNKGIIRLVFLPGSNFNLESIRFGK